MPSSSESPVSSSVSSTEYFDGLDMLGRHFEPALDQLGSSRLQNILEMDLPRPKALLSHHGYEVGQGAIAGGAVAVVVVLCVGFLLVLLVIGVLKMKDTPLPRKRRCKQQDDGMSWDDSGMNITVNPLGDVEKNVPDEDFSEEDGSDGEDSDGTFREEEASDEEIEREVLPHLDSQRGGLEWDDDAVMTTSTTTNTRSYRV
ncbi:hypothetical protein DICVIV_01181 [Dictyocaulus viviparus]|uniref:Calsyntenin C-terminal domain-containing protein n=1 Tax=Dictyocaulus viviparus TaxID=29172 RepID=A0A0D8YDA8_DICVI|nr:hypothetical protein DICVIV_01181 [Dictyocaulus viviparus]